jgi:hypothetical protein
MSKLAKQSRLNFWRRRHDGDPRLLNQSESLPGEYPASLSKESHRRRFPASAAAASTAARTKGFMERFMIVVGGVLVMMLRLMLSTEREPTRQKVRVDLDAIDPPSRKICRSPIEWCPHGKHARARAHLLTVDEQTHGMLTTCHFPTNAARDSRLVSPS